MFNLYNYKLMKKKWFNDEGPNRSLFKWLRAMKLTVLFLMVALIQVSASVYSQQTKLSISLKDASVREVLRTIEDQSEFFFLYKNENIDVNRIVNVDIKEKSVEYLLDQIFKGTTISYEVVNRQIVLMDKAKDNDFDQSLSQQKAVSGKVTDPTGASLPGVAVVVKGTTTGIITDNNGNYSLTNIPENAILQFSFVGMKTQEVSVGNKTTINLLMEEEAIGLEEVVAIGYGTQNKKTTTGSISNVKTDDLNMVNAVSIDNLLQGKVAGLNIRANTAQPGGGLSINIRGTLSPNGSNSPLYVIDGVPISGNERVDNFGNGQSGFAGQTDRDPLITINPNDIESIDVLKDASAAAIYGSAAANGVILITTKRGKEQKTTITYSGTYSVQTPQKYLEPLNSTDFMQYHELYAQDLWKVNNRIAPYGNTDPSTVQPYTHLFSDTDIANASKGINTNWVDYIMQDGFINDQNISISGGSKNTKVYTSFNYLNHEALLKNSDFNRFSGRLNLDQNLGSHVHLQLGFSYSQVKNQNQLTGYGSPDNPSPINSGIRFAPTFGVYDESGNLSQSYYIRTPNPQSWLMVINNTTTNRLFFTPKLDIEISNDLKATITAGIDQSRSDLDNYIPVSAQFQTALTGNAQLSTNFIGNYNTEGYFTYDKIFGDSRLSVVLGAGYYKTNSNNYGLEGIDFLSDALGTSAVQIAANKERNQIYSGKSERTKISQFSRINYTLLDRYMLTFNLRNDGSSIWAKGQKWGFFPGVSGAWVISQENFMKGLTHLNQLKLRVGYGTVGNEGLGGNYSISTYGPSAGYSFPFGGNMSPGILQTQLGNTDLHWEKDVTINSGLDFVLFNNRISGSIDYFERTAHDLFNFRILPSNNAIGRIGANIGSTKSKGYEVTLNTRNIKTKGFTWTSDFSFSSYRAYWMERSNPEDLIRTPWIGKNDDISAIYGWKTNGIIKSVDEIPAYQTGAYLGNIKYVDFNKDGKLDEKDVQNLGNRDPKAYYGFGNSFTYKGFDLNIFFNGTLGGMQQDNWYLIGNIQSSFFFDPQSPTNAERHTLNTWASFNPNGTYPGIAPDVVGDATNPSKHNDFGLRQVNWGRLKNVTLGYNLPFSLLSRTDLIQYFKIFVEFQNIAVIGNYSGLDPEMESGRIYPYPIARTTAFGISVKF